MAKILCDPPPNPCLSYLCKRFEVSSVLYDYNPTPLQFFSSIPLSSLYNIQTYASQQKTIRTPLSYQFILVLISFLLIIHLGCFVKLQGGEGTLENCQVLQVRFLILSSSLCFPFEAEPCPWLRESCNMFYCIVCLTTCLFLYKKNMLMYFFII